MRHRGGGGARQSATLLQAPRPPPLPCYTHLDEVGEGNVVGGAALHELLEVEDGAVVVLLREGRRKGGREEARREGQRRVTGALIGRRMVDALMGGQHGKPGCWIIAFSPTL